MVRALMVLTSIQVETVVTLAALELVASEEEPVWVEALVMQLLEAEGVASDYSRQAIQWVWAPHYWTSSLPLD